MRDRDTVGVRLPVTDSLGTGLPSTAAWAQQAEAAGFDSLWAGDHLFFHQPNLECLTSLAVAMGATEQIGIGAGVLLPALREPVVTAKQLTTLAVVSGGRLEVGIGIGGEYGPEWRAVGQNPRVRGQRTDEFLEFYDRCLSGTPVDYQGHEIAVTAPAMLPQPVERPVIWIGGRSDAAIRRTVRHGDGWLGFLQRPEHIAERRDQLAHLAAAAERQPPRIGYLAFVSIGAHAERDAHRFAASHYRTDPDRFAKWAIAGTVDEVATELTNYRQAGAAHLVLYPVQETTESCLADLAAVRDSLQMEAANPTTPRSAGEGRRWT